MAPALPGRSSRKYAEDAVDAACPAHVYADIYWLDRNELDSFDLLHDEWWACFRLAQAVLLKPVSMGEQSAAEDHMSIRQKDGEIERADRMAGELVAFLTQLEQREMKRKEKSSA